MGRAYRGPLISGGRTCNNWSCGSVCVGRTIVPGFVDSRDGPLIHNIGPLTGEPLGVTFGFPQSHLHRQLYMRWGFMLSRLRLPFPLRVSETGRPSQAPENSLSMKRRRSLGQMLSFSGVPSLTSAD